MRENLERAVRSGKEVNQNMADGPDGISGINLDFSENLSTTSSFVSTMQGDDDRDLYSVLKSSIAMLHELSFAVQQIFTEASRGIDR